MWAKCPGSSLITTATPVLPALPAPLPALSPVPTVHAVSGAPDDARDGYGQLRTQASQLFLYKPEQ